MLNCTGTVIFEEEKLIKARIKHYQVIIKFLSLSENNVKINVFVHKFFLNRLQVAKTILYQISEELNK